MRSKKIILLLLILILPNLLTSVWVCGSPQIVIPLSNVWVENTRVSIRQARN